MAERRDGMLDDFHRYPVDCLVGEDNGGPLRGVVCRSVSFPLQAWGGVT